MSSALKRKLKNKKAPEGWNMIEEVIEDFEQQMKDAVADEAEGKRKCEASWKIHRIHWEKNRFIYDLMYVRKVMSRELVSDEKEGGEDRGVPRRWRQQQLRHGGLCCLHSRQHASHWQTRTAHAMPAAACATSTVAVVHAAAAQLSEQHACCSAVIMSTRMQQRLTPLCHGSPCLYCSSRRQQFDWLCREKIADGPLIAKWRKPGYEILCSMLAIQKGNHNFGTTSHCRVPLRLRASQVREQQQGQHMPAHRRNWSLQLPPPCRSAAVVLCWVVLASTRPEPAHGSI
jgi:bud site selection protein 31